MVGKILCWVVAGMFLVLPGLAQEIYQEEPVENFEKNVYSKNDSIVQAYQPDISITEMVTAHPESAKALYLRMQKSLDTPVTLLLKKPYETSAFIHSIRLYVFSSGFSGQLSVLIRNKQDEIKSIPLCNLNYSGWKKIEIGLGKYLNQEDYAIFRNEKQIIQGLVLQGSDLKAGRENILILDDIVLLVRKKMLVPDHVKKLMQ